jgi:hypothetical protein
MTGLATIIRDTFSSGEAQSIHEALGELCDPIDAYGWSSAGVYSFWDPATLEVLYVGLAGNLAQRFGQHTGRVGAPDSACKRRQIEGFFEANDRLGFSILVQSPLSQPDCAAVDKVYGEILRDDGYRELTQHGHVAIVQTEGLLIESHRLRNGRSPQWNRVSGSTLGAAKATASHSTILEYMTGQSDDFMVARRTLRALAGNATWTAYEEELHALRAGCALLQVEPKECLVLLKPARWERIVSDGYLPADQLELFR